MTKLMPAGSNEWIDPSEVSSVYLEHYTSGTCSGIKVMVQMKTGRTLLVAMYGGMDDGQARGYMDRLTCEINDRRAG